MNHEMAVGHSGKYTATGSMDTPPGGPTLTPTTPTKLAGPNRKTP